MTLASPDSRPHFQILDGLRGVAALTVVIFHICEAHATSHVDQLINHGYLAVDFFFLLSGFVIGYAYDGRWPGITIKGFFKRRLIRLQPMVVMGSVIGALCFYYSASPIWPGISQVPVWQVIAVMLLGATLLPLPVSMDIRGWQEMHPLDGPAWSLFFEYIGNILYALIIRRFSKTALAILAVLSAIALVHLAVFANEGHVIGGWSLDAKQLHIGFVRLMYPFVAGLLLFRVAKLTQIKNAFLWSSLLLLFVLAFPRIGGLTQLWQNGIYEAVVIILVFPLVIYIGASGRPLSGAANKICKFIGDLSYPIYITHYPFVYIYTGWVATHKVSLHAGLPFAVLTFVVSVSVAYACLKWYDEPVRRWLQKKWA
ncbi:acyltransferase family protein [Deminuibacter soli]|uniref:Acyltransferase n=1 Tax=Deminuibacter soli TaxID=2291815 RepID=A0A3E1NKS3_9BACT|nr:acyltransferase [Deminuibacter soli]RFM28526.1 acyltransferase [Deminuibacter soli]